MKKRGHYCKVCGEYKANEKFSGKGQRRAPFVKPCRRPPRQKSRQKEMMLTPACQPSLAIIQRTTFVWLKKRMKDRRDAVRALATEQYEMRFPPRIELDELEDGFEEDFDFLYGRGN